MKPLISIIIPVYNVKPYLRKCIDSVIAQTYRNIEIILVDDGSTDGSGDLCDKIQREDNRIKVYHKQNGGLSSARNYGIEKAEGEFIGLVDSDDYIHMEMYERLYSLLMENEADLSECKLTDVYNGKVQSSNKASEVFVVNGETAIDYALTAEIASVAAVDKLYRRSLFDHIRYPEGKTVEDAYVIVDLLSECSKVVISTEELYYYVHRKGSITTDIFSKKNLDAIDAYEKNYNIIKDKYPAILETAKMRLCWAYFYVLDRIIYDNTEENQTIKHNVISYLRNNFTFIIRNKHFSKERKIATAMLVLSPSLYKMCVTLQNSKRFQ